MAAYFLKANRRVSLGRASKMESYYICSNVVMGVAPPSLFLLVRSKSQVLPTLYRRRCSLASAQICLPLILCFKSPEMSLTFSLSRGQVHCSSVFPSSTLPLSLSQGLIAPLGTSPASVLGSLALLAPDQLGILTSSLCKLYRMLPAAASAANEYLMECCHLLEFSKSNLCCFQGWM